MARQIDIEKYTGNEIYKNLIAIEEHLKHFNDDKSFCTNCLGKHLSYLEILQEECASAKCKLNSIYKEIKKWAIELKENLFTLDEKGVEDIITKCRNFRKKIEESDGGSGGHLK